jgi:hypothetical protein
MPLSNADWSWYTTTAANLSNDYPVNSSSILSEDYMGWATESYDIAKNYVYPGFTTGQVPSTNYDDLAKPILEQNMMLAGARLANLIEVIYGNNNMFLQ